jgi:hypothetical protein
VRKHAHHLIDHVDESIGWKVTPFPITELIEFWASMCGPKVDLHPPNLWVCESRDLPHADAEFRPHQNLICVNERIWDSASDGDAQARWVLAHECGHVTLKHYAGAGLYCETHSVVEPEADSEHQANWFADELMMDSRLINLAADGINALMQRFLVSEAMAARRLQDLVRQRAAR